MALVILPRSLAALIPGVERRTTASGATVGEVIASLDARWPGVADRLCESGPALRAYINVFVDGDRAASLDDAVGPDATIHVIPAVAGGTEVDARGRQVVRDDPTGLTILDQWVVATAAWLADPPKAGR